MTAWGYTPKDPGAGLEHGEFTHRLQWNALMTRFEEDEGTEAAWQHTPFELYTMIGEIDERGARGGEASAWGVMMDTGGSTISAEATDRRDIERASEGFARPDNVTKAFRMLAEDEENLLAQIVRDRYDKRRRNAQAQSENTRRIKEQVTRERDQVVQACNQGDPGSRDRLDQFVRQNAAYINMELTDLDIHMGEMHCPRVVIKADSNINYDLYMEEYKREKINSPRYKLLDEAHPEDLLLIGQGEEDLTDEEKRGRVLELRSRSRGKFGKGPVFEAAEDRELHRRVHELTQAANAIGEEIDEEELYAEAVGIGRANGLAAAIDHVAQKHDRATQLHDRWRRDARNVVRSIRKLQNRMRASGEEVNTRAADQLERIVTRLEAPPDDTTKAFLESDELVQQAEQPNDFDVEIRIREALLPLFD